MTTPVTTLDARYSGADAVATSWDETLAVIQAAELFWITTVRADGRPHVTPLVAVWRDGAIHFCTGDTEQKFANLRANQNVILTTGRNEWDRGLDVVIEGRAVQVTDEDMLKRLAEAWTLKWDGGWQYLVRDGVFYHQDEGEILPFAVPVFSVSPTQVLAFTKGPAAGHTRHKF